MKFEKEMILTDLPDEYDGTPAYFDNKSTLDDLLVDFLRSNKDSDLYDFLGKRIRLTIEIMDKEETLLK